MKHLFTLAAVLLNLPIYSQINVGSSDRVTIASGKLEEKDLKNFKSSKTLFVYRDSDKNKLEKWKTALKSAWVITPLELVSLEEYTKRRQEPNTSFFTLDGFVKKGSSSAPMHLYLSLWMNTEEGKKTFCRIEVDPTDDAFWKVYGKITSKDNTAMALMYQQEVELRNWNPLYLKNALQYVNSALETSKERWLFESKAYTDLSMLKKDTLYIADYAFPFKGKQKPSKEPFAIYPFPYKIIQSEALVNLGLTSKQGIYYLTFIRSNFDKFITITNSLSGELLYADYESMSRRGLDQNDVKKLTDKISNPQGQ